MSGPTAGRCLDIHQHYGSMTSVSLGEVGAATAYDDAGWAEAEWRVRADTMTSMGITAACVMPGNSYQQDRGIVDTRAMNDSIAAYIARDPERFPLGAAVIEPLHGPAGLDELDRVAELGLRAVSYHTRMQGVAIDNVWIKRHLSRMAELRLVPLVHCYVDSSLESPLHLLELARAFPELTFVALDALGSYRHVLECSLVARECPNVLFETSMAYGNSLAMFADEFGSERVVFGTDLYSHPVRWRTSNTPAAIAAMLGDEAATANILYRNAERLFA